MKIWIASLAVLFLGVPVHAGICSKALRFGKYAMVVALGARKQEGLPINRQYIALDNPSDVTLIARWNERETFHGYQAGAMVDNWGYFEDDLRFIISLSDWRTFTNGNIRMWIHLRSLAEMYKPPADDLALALEVRRFTSAAEIAKWNQRFPEQPIP